MKKIKIGQGSVNINSTERNLKSTRISKPMKIVQAKRVSKVIRQPKKSILSDQTSDSKTIEITKISPLSSKITPIRTVERRKTKSYTKLQSNYEKFSKKILMSSFSGFNSSFYLLSLLIHQVAFTMGGPLVILLPIFRKMGLFCCFSSSTAKHLTFTLLSNMQFFRLSQVMVVQYIQFGFCYLVELDFKQDGEIGDWSTMLAIAISYLMRCSVISAKYGTLDMTYLNEMSSRKMEIEELEREMMFNNWAWQNMKVLEFESEMAFENLSIDKRTSAVRWDFRDCDECPQLKDHCQHCADDGKSFNYMCEQLASLEEERNQFYKGENLENESCGLLRGLEWTGIGSFSRTKGENPVTCQDEGEKLLNSVSISQGLVLKKQHSNQLEVVDLKDEEEITSSENGGSEQDILKIYKQEEYTSLKNIHQYLIREYKKQNPIKFKNFGIEILVSIYFGLVSGFQRLYAKQNFHGTNWYSRVIFYGNCFFMMGLSASLMMFEYCARLDIKRIVFTIHEANLCLKPKEMNFPGVALRKDDSIQLLPQVDLLDHYSFDSIQNLRYLSQSYGRKFVLRHKIMFGSFLAISLACFSLFFFFQYGPYLRDQPIESMKLRSISVSFGLWLMTMSVSLLIISAEVNQKLDENLKLLVRLLSIFKDLQKNHYLYFKNVTLPNKNAQRKDTDSENDEKWDVENYNHFNSPNFEKISSTSKIHKKFIEQIIFKVNQAGNEHVTTHSLLEKVCHKLQFQIEKIKDAENEGKLSIGGLIITKGKILNMMFAVVGIFLSVYEILRD